MSNSYEGVHQDKKKGKGVHGKKKLRTTVLYDECKRGNVTVKRTLKKGYDNL